MTTTDNPPEDPVSPKKDHKHSNDGGKRTFEQDILLAISTVVVAGIISFVVSFFGMLYQLRQAKQRDIYQAKDQIFRDFVKASADWREAVWEGVTIKYKYDLDQFYAELNTIVPNIPTNLPLALSISNRPTPTLAIVRAQVPSEQEVQRRQYEATANLKAVLEFADAHFGSTVRSNADAFWKFKTLPTSTVDMEKHRDDMVAAMRSGDLHQQRAVLGRIDNDMDDSVHADPRYQILTDIAQAMGKEIQGDR